MSQNSITPQQKTDTVTLGGMMKHVEKVMQRYTGEMIGIPNTSEAVYYTQAEADAYNALLEGALNSTDPLTAEEAAAYNAAIAGAEKEAGDTLSEAEANLYNATLDGAVDTSTVKTPAVPQKVKTYVDAQIQAHLVNPISDSSIANDQTFSARDVVSVNGTMYMADTATSDLPQTKPIAQDGKILTQNGKILLAPSSTTSADWHSF